MVFVCKCTYLKQIINCTSWMYHVNWKTGAYNLLSLMRAAEPMNTQPISNVRENVFLFQYLSLWDSCYFHLSVDRGGRLSCPSIRLSRCIAVWSSTTFFSLFSSSSLFILKVEDAREKTVVRRNNAHPCPYWKRLTNCFLSIRVKTQQLRVGRIPTKSIRDGSILPYC